MQSHFVFSSLGHIPNKLLGIAPQIKNLFYIGKKELLSSPLIIAIVGTRKPNPYTRSFTNLLANKLSSHAVIISGGALGTDIIAHSAALPNTIMVSPSSLDIIYPSSNSKIIKMIAEKALILSEYEKNYTPKTFSFIQRNRIIIGLSDIVIIPQADLNSGTMQSAKMAIKQNKPLYVLPHRIEESLGTQMLLQKNLAKAIYNISSFLQDLGMIQKYQDELLDFCLHTPDYQVALQKFGEQLLIYELEGKIKRENGRVIVL